MNLPSEGFAAVAEWIALDPDNETFIFRKFGRLAARNLLYQQARITKLEKELEELDKQLAESKDMAVKDAARTWEQLVKQDFEGEEHARRHMKLVIEMKEALKEYHETLVLQSQVSNLHKPSQRTLNAFRHWFNTPFPVLGGQSKHFLDAKDGLVALTAPRDFDPVSQLLRRYWPAKKEATRDGSLHIGRFNEASISTAGKVITILVAANFLVESIYALYFAATPLQRLGLIQVLTTIFALCAGFMTNARRAELFAVTAAYAAVLVVFVGSAEFPGGGNTGNGQGRGA
ncbi:hypothetical protein C8A01DRAFT_20386 [Parachaetomium inaequale]|uniref:DUF6594 domain-containing protein n=1 Tax=Parachaetomium inaequale TaxID=2588326 RepID=A0AAN6PA17_9PEZI|nr:hypothetical protein C8A01DRAFT_20386 [Parachaetomium inaequale]